MTDSRKVEFFEFTWPGKDPHMKVWIKPTEAPGIYWFQVEIGRRTALVGAMDREALIEFLPTLKTWGTSSKAGG